MPVTQEQLEEIQADLMADDVAIDMEKMSLWSYDEAVAYFESGGTDEPRVAATPLGRKPRVAFLHGVASNETIFKMQLSATLMKVRHEHEKKTPL